SGFDQYRSHLPDIGEGTKNQACQLASLAILLAVEPKMQPLRFKPIGQVYQALSGSGSPGAGSSPSSCLFFTIVGTNGVASIRWRRVYAADSGRHTRPASAYEHLVRAPLTSSPAISGPCTIVVGPPAGSTWYAARYEYTGTRQASAPD